MKTSLGHGAGADTVSVSRQGILALIKVQSPAEETPLEMVALYCPGLIEAGSVNSACHLVSDADVAVRVSESMSLELPVRTSCRVGRTPALR